MMNWNCDNLHSKYVNCQLLSYQTFNSAMGDFQVKKQPKKYDAVIVGSGAGGGMAAYILANAGLKVCIVEAGELYDPQKDVTQLKNPWDSPRRGASTKLRHFGDFDDSYGGWSLDGVPAKNGYGQHSDR